ncbi:MAG TPA: UDP-N-acetylglucosamine 2-epimerase (non-hydrolyzing) [Xanthobacteraceae bacterium]|nr:UDP-N-acetylglucosamine 2-epimerase (non-hydrolyzing) [Xanthobacteraceae bacterium]
MRILSVFGTRPEAIKMAPVVLALAQQRGVESRVCVTGQHREMLDQVMATFTLNADYDLGIMRPGQALSDVFARVLLGLDPILAQFQPDYVLVQGDTVSSTAAALAAFLRRIAVGHVEAGLRTGNLKSPWPEEANRRLTAVVTTRHYAPTRRARAALLSEGHAPDSVIVSGNTVIDALTHVAREVTSPGALKEGLDRTFSWLDRHKRVVLVTGHRRESFGAGFARICDALRTIARRGDVEIVYPVHLNPNVRGPVFERLSGFRNVRLIEPLEYRQFVYLMTRCHLILTDSGGVQEEAPSLRKPVLVMRDTSERIEAVEAGVARLVSTNPAAIVAAVDEIMDCEEAYAAMASGANPFGDGRASERIVRDLVTCKREFRPSPSSDLAMSGFRPPRRSPHAALTSSA